MPRWRPSNDPTLLNLRGRKALKKPTDRVSPQLILVELSTRQNEIITPDSVWDYVDPVLVGNGTLETGGMKGWGDSLRG
ncbi:hypothetical protein MMC28_003254 [Mycoblastus sanguinarius]|nr:hypothetical protein [Mycoblastus sanguinarius]